MSQFPVRDGALVVGGMSLPRLAERVGSTPFYAYDRRVVRRQVDGLRRFMPKELQLHYAMKANPMPALVCFMATIVDGLDVASLSELRVALDSGMSPQEISFAGPGKGLNEIRAAVAAEVTLNIESELELNRAADASAALAMTANVAVRVNPDFELKSSGMKMGGGSQQFGVDAEQVPRLLRLTRQLGLNFVGFHVFTGSQNLHAQAIVTAHQQIFALVTRLLDGAPSLPRIVNIGGGLGIPYFPGEEPLDLEPIGAGLTGHLDSFRHVAPGAKIVMELGRYLVGESGVYVCRVVDRKVSRGATFLITDGGLHHHLAATGNFGQILRRNYPVTIGNRMNAARETVRVVGPLCTPLDLLADSCSLPTAEVGDLVVVYQSGAYGFTASPRDFLSHPHPAEVLV